MGGRVSNYAARKAHPEKISYIFLKNQFPTLWDDC